MSWPPSVDPELRALIEEVCTEKEIEALKLKAAGYGLLRISTILDISKASVRERLRNAERKIARRWNVRPG